ncbi:hypothetical protein [Chlorella virus XW01]|nr:hypothetical protein [Chlorella virus XW01]
MEKNIYIIVSLVIIVLSNIFNLNTSLLPLLIIAIIFFYFKKDLENFVDKQKEEKLCTKPTIDNPFMNYTVGDQIKNPKRLPACSIDLHIKKEIIKNFHNDYKDPYQEPFNQMFKNKFKPSDRNFYTLPVTTATNDQKGFAESLYGNIGLCKSFNEKCIKNIDNRYSSARYYVSY